MYCGRQVFVGLSLLTVISMIALQLRFKNYKSTTVGLYKPASTIDTSSRTNGNSRLSADFEKTKTGLKEGEEQPDPNKLVTYSSSISLTSFRFNSSKKPVLNSERVSPTHYHATSDLDQLVNYTKPAATSLLKELIISPSHLIQAQNSPRDDPSIDWTSTTLTTTPSKPIASLTVRGQTDRSLKVRTVLQQLLVTTVDNLQGKTHTTNINRKNSDQVTSSSPTALPHNQSCLIAVHQNWICGSTRLGNKLFMIAAVVGAIANTNHSFVLVKTEKCEWVPSLQNIFVALQSAIVLDTNATISWKNQREAGFTAYSPININENTLVSGFRQSWKYFNSTPAQSVAVKNMFTLTSALVSAANNVLAAAMASFNLTDAILVGVHARLGDLQQKRFRDYGYQMANTSFYKTAFDIMVDRHGKDVLFIVASDSLDIAKSKMENFTGIYRIYFTGLDQNHDFAVLTRCNHSIISGGTFGFWVAWLAGGEVLYFNDFAAPGTSFAKGFCSKCFYPMEWTPV